MLTWSPKVFSGIHLRAISQKVLKIPIHKIKIAVLKLQPHLQGDNELKTVSEIWVSTTVILQPLTDSVQLNDLEVKDFCVQSQLLLQTGHDSRTGKHFSFVSYCVGCIEDHS